MAILFLFDYILLLGFLFYFCRNGWYGRDLLILALVNFLFLFGAFK